VTVLAILFVSGLWALAVVFAFKTGGGRW